jgi:hypothetical protein
MWKKYGGNHTGYCLEFANDGLFSYARQVQYDEQLTNLDLNNPDVIFLFRKTVSWQREQEARIVMFPGAGDEFLKIFPKGEHPFVSFDPSLLRRVILGKKMLPEHRAMISKWAAQRIPLVLVEPSEL